MIIDVLTDLIAYLTHLLSISMILLIFELVIFFILLKLAGSLIKNLSHRKFKSSINETNVDSPYFTVGFFHPFCNSGGGGERVLWSAIKVLQDT